MVTACVKTRCQLIEELERRVLEERWITPLARIQSGHCSSENARAEVIASKGLVLSYFYGYDIQR